MRRFVMVLLAACVAPVDSVVEEEEWPGPVHTQQVPVPGGVVIDGPTEVYGGNTYTWTVSGSSIFPGNRVDFGWGGTDSGGPCPPPAGGVCVDVSNPARRVFSGPADAAGEVEITMMAPASHRSHIFLQALLVNNAGSDKSEPFRLDLLRAPPACNADFGDVVTELAPTSPEAFMFDANRIAVKPTELYVALNNDVYAFPHDLSTESGLVLADVAPAGNKGLVYDGVADRFFVHQVAHATPTFNTYSGDLSTPQNTLASAPNGTNSGAVDANGHLHVPLSSGAGIAEYDGNLNFLGVWATGVASGRDIDVSPGNTLYHLSASGTVTAFDLDRPGRPQVGSIAVEFNSQGLEVDGQGIVYVSNRSQHTVYAYHISDVELGSFTDPGSRDPASMAYNPHNGLLTVGYVASLNGVLTNYRPCW